MTAKHIVLTGCTRGLGRALVDRFVEAGHSVSGCGRSQSRIQEIRQTFPRHHEFDIVDVSDPRAVEAWADRVMEHSGPPDLLINNAAIINSSRPLWEVPTGEFASLIQINLMGVFHVLRAFLPEMLKRKRGILVNLSSGWGRSVSPEVVPYCTSKWAIEGMTRGLALELPAGMAAIPVNPGIIDTEMLRSCFGAGASAHPNAEQWSHRAAPYLLNLSAAENGSPCTVPA